MFNIICDTLRETATAGILPSYLATQALSPEMRLIDLGIDSLGAMTLMSEISGRLSAPMLDMEMGPETTLGEIAAGFSNAMPEPLQRAA